LDADSNEGDSVILLFTDFGAAGPYVGQMRAVLSRAVPEVPTVELMSDAPAFNAKASAYLLAALAQRVEPGDVCVAVVDPGVGGVRDALVLQADGCWFVGPDNGLLAITARHAKQACWWCIDWRPKTLSASFHGRDLFSPIASRLVKGEVPPGEPLEGGAAVGGDWPDDLAEIIYLDHFGNAMTGLRANVLCEDTRLEVSGKEFVRARTFSDVPDGTAFWYENANGLAEVAVNGRRADKTLALAVGNAVGVS